MNPLIDALNQPLIDEKYNSRKSVLGANPSQEVSYVIIGVNNEIDAQSLLLGFVPALWPSPIGFGFLPIQSATVEQITDVIWTGDVVWSFTPPQQEGNETLSFDTGGGRAKITNSFSTTRYAASGTAPDFQGAINVTKDGVEGVEILVPALNFTVTRRFDAKFVDNNYILTLRALTGTVNASSFRGLAPGECLFEGAQGNQQTSEEPWDISFKFTAEENASPANGNAISVGPIANITKNGQQYLWVRYQDVDDTSANALVKRPLAAYVETVYTSADWTGLGIQQ